MTDELKLRLREVLGRPAVRALVERAAKGEVPWGEVADAVADAGIKVAAKDQSVVVVARWFSDELKLCTAVSMGVPDPDLTQFHAAYFLSLYDRMIAAPGGMVEVGSPGFRAMLEEMAAVGIIRDNERFGSVQAQIESVCTERWEPTAHEISSAITGDPLFAEIKASIWRPNGTLLSQPDHIAEQEEKRRTVALAELQKQIEETAHNAQEGNP